MSITFVKGHGTGNDFVVIPDPDDQLSITPALVAAICDRHRGVGADGLLRVVRTAHPDAEWFMDYRNADGSLAEMCGNGVRVYARYLVESGLVTGDRVPILTRAGLVVASVTPGEISVTMPAARLAGSSTALVGGARFEGTVVSVGNPHLVCPVPDPDPLELTHAPVIDPVVFPDGANVEFVTVVGPGHLRLRVFERGAGETLSCGSGAVAAAAVEAGTRPADTITVDVPGGRLRVSVRPDHTVLAGPAVLVASGVYG